MPPTHSRPGRQANSGLNDSAGPSEFSGRAHAGEHLAQHVVHGLAGSCGVAGLDRLQHLAMRVEIAHRVTEQRVGGRHAILQRRVDQRRERQEEAVPGGGKHRFMESGVRQDRIALAGGGRAHRFEGLADGDDLVRVVAARGKSRGLAFETQAHFQKLDDEVARCRAGAQPTQHRGVQEIPVLQRADARATPRAG
ncbi:MAG: hypothetical protein E5V74_22050, partial [Mesorhizobium sp.]